MFSFLAHLQNKNAESICEWPGTIKTAYISGAADGGWAQAADPAVTAQAAARSDRSLSSITQKLWNSLTFVLRWDRQGGI